MGFPTRILRQRLGKKLRDIRPIEHPEYEVSADRINQLENVAIGAGLNIARASIVAEWNPTISGFDVYHQEEAWNPEHSQAHPVLARSSVGVYIYMLSPTYLDNDGNEVATDITAARVSVMNIILEGLRCYALIDGYTVQVHIAVDGTPTDARFWLEIL